MHRSISRRIATVLTWIMEEKLIWGLKVGYDAAKEGVRTPLFILVGEVIVDIIQKGRWKPWWWGILNPTPIWLVYAHITQPVAACQSLITPTMVLVNRHMKKIEEVNCVVQMLKQQLLEITHPSLLTKPKGESRSIYSTFLHTIQDELGMKNCDEA